MNVSYQSKQGFTLIEMMLVVTVLGIGTLYSMSFIRDKQRENEIRNTVQQIQNVLQLGLEYHSRFDEWPADPAALIENMGVDPLVFCTSWPGTGLAITPNPCPSQAAIQIAPIKVPVQNLSESLEGAPITFPDNFDKPTERDNINELYANFSVMLTLPDKLPHIDTTIRSIQYYLPSAQIVGTNQIQMFTSARISLPQTPNTYGYITHAGFGKTSANLPVAYQCYQYDNFAGELETMEKHVFLAVMYGLTDYKEWFAKDGLIDVIRDQYSAQNVMFLNSSASNCSKQGNCTITFQDASKVIKQEDSTINLDIEYLNRIMDISPQSGDGLPSAVYYYLSLCVPYKMWQASTGKNFGRVLKPGQYWGAKTVQDNGQCQDSWGQNCGLQGDNLYSILGL